MGDRARADGRARDLEELAVPLEDLFRERFHHDLRRLHEAQPRLLHRDAKARVLHGGGAAAEAEETAAAGEDIEQRDLLRHPHGVVPGQDDDGGDNTRQGIFDFRVLIAFDVADARQLKTPDRANQKFKNQRSTEMLIYFDV